MPKKAKAADCGHMDKSGKKEAPKFPFQFKKGEKPAAKSAKKK